ncbi:MAG: nucleotidyltransferase domain-containing protein [Candidatus Helarchaeota archaeon]
MKNKTKFLDLFREMINKIRLHVPLKAVILFGSHVRGTAHKFSDYDLVIIADFQEEYFDRSAWISEFTPFISVDLFCYTPEEFEELFKSYNLTAIDAIGEGIVLFGDDYIAPYKKRYKDFIRRGMRKTKCVLIPPSQ